MPSKSEPRRRAGPRRSEASKQAILDATRDELATSGWRAFSVDAVAKRASASKQTIYRWWPSIASLCVESVTSALPRRSTNATDAIPRIAELLQPLVTFGRAGSNYAALKGALLAAADDPGARDVLRIWLTAEVRGPLRLILAELAVKGRVRRDWDADEAMSLLLGPAWHRLIILNAPLGENYPENAARRLVSALAPD